MPQHREQKVTDEPPDAAPPTNRRVQALRRRAQRDKRHRRVNRRRGERGHGPTPPQWRAFDTKGSEEDDD